MVFENAGPEGLSTDDRCLVGFNAGPPMIPAEYNNNMQLIQTKDHIVIVNEMVHTARIIRLDSEHHTKQLKWEGDSSIKGTEGIKFNPSVPFFIARWLRRSLPNRRETTDFHR